MRNAANQPGSSFFGNVRSSTNLLYLLVSAHSTCFTAFTRHSFGVAELGANSAAAFALLLVYICVTGSQAMCAFMFVWFAALALQRLAMFVQGLRGHYEHSRYEGYPWLGFMVPFVRRVQGAKLCEMLICLIAGPLLMGVDDALGSFVFFGTFSLMGKAAIEGQIEQNRIQSMRDARIEMEYYADQFNGDNF
jgi:hypothetical protein